MLSCRRSVTAWPGRPTMAMPASSAASTIASPSIISVLPASTDSAVAPAALHRLDRRHADDRHVEPHVLIRLRHLDDADARAGQLPGARDHLRRCLPSPRPRRPPRTSPRSSGRCRGRRSRRRCGSRTSRSLLLVVGRRAARQHARRARAAARGTPSNPAARCRCRAARRRRAEISASVFRDLQRASARRAASGRARCRQKSLVCLTCPAITAWVTPASFSRLMHVPELAERDPVQRRRRRPRGRVGQVGKGFFLERDDGDVVARRARRVEDEERKPAVAGDQTEPHGACAVHAIRPRDHFFGPPRRRAAG